MSSDIRVTFANLNYAFIKFQEQLKNLCQSVSDNDKKDVYKSFKKVKSFIYEYLNYVKEEQIRVQIINSLDRINKDIMEDREYLELSKSDNLNDKILFNQKYYSYLTRMFRALGIFGDDLSSTFMPTKSDRQKLLKYTNNNPFFEHFTFYKSSVSERLSEFNIFNFKLCFDYTLGFYYAYYGFIDEESRLLIDRVYSNILGVVLDHRILSLIIRGYKYLNQEEKLFIKDIDNQLHNALLNIFFRYNYSYSDYGIMPRMESKVIIDRTTI